MKIDLRQFRQTFLQESADHVIAMEAGLLDLRSTPGDTELLNAIFRSAHSIKGGAGSFGLNQLVVFTHGLENLLDRLRSMEIPATEVAIGVLLESVDVLRLLLAGGTDGVDVPMPAAGVELMRRIEALVAEAEDSPAIMQGEKALQAADSPADLELKLYKIDFEPASDLFLSGANPIMLLRNLAALGSVSVCQMHSERLPPLEELNPVQCFLSWTIELATLRPETDLREVFEFVEHLAQVTIQTISLPSSPEIVAGDVAAGEAASAAIEPRQRSKPAPAQAKQAAGRKTAATTDAGSIRVSTEKVDRLIDLVGELVIAHGMTAQMVEDFTPGCLPRLRDAVAAIERNTRELHERVMAVRMLPVGALFQRYARTVYDIAQSTGKQITLEISGEETEIDKAILEQLGDPLTHLIRNAADHGIELPDTRRAAGKAEEGIIHLRAFHRSGKLVIEISDDGGGIDQARVYAKAVERGLIVAGVTLSEEQINMLLFEPGFSTRDEVSDLSGRGVGMDVVKRNVQQLSGTVSMTSTRGVGSMVSIELPLTLAILDGLLVRVADRTLVLPLLSVIETVAPQPGQVTRIAEQGEVVVIREESIPLLRLHRFLGIPEHDHVTNQPSSGREKHLVIVVEAGRKKIGLVVDELLGQQQVVVKSLERNLRRVDGLMGATILGDGRVAPIVDVAGLASMNLFSLRTLAHLSSRPAVQGAQIQAS